MGNDQCSRPYSALILNLSAMSFGEPSANAIRTLSFGAKRGGLCHDTGDKGVSSYHLEHGGELVWELGSGYFGARDKDGNFDPEKFRHQTQHPIVKMTEINSSQGPSPVMEDRCPRPRSPRAHSWFPHRSRYWKLRQACLIFLAAGRWVSSCVSVNRMSLSRS